MQMICPIYLDRLLSEPTISFVGFIYFEAWVGATNPKGTY
ncbi:hypothetical protein SAMN05428962_0956 [Paenibacillus sp. BC26]|nr:hypothetical protein SAMN05428962_0956 [Paenibacillus sp. BC26]